MYYTEKGPAANRYIFCSLTYVHDILIYMSNWCHHLCNILRSLWQIWSNKYINLAQIWCLTCLSPWMSQWRLDFIGNFFINWAKLPGITWITLFMHAEPEVYCTMVDEFNLPFLGGAWSRQLFSKGTFTGID